jgi:hypothetical protein
VATYSTGVTATFPGATLTEIVDLSFNFGGGMPDGRGTAFKAVQGSVQISTLGGATSSVYGTRGSLVIAGGGLALTVTAVCTDVAAVAELNGVTRYSYTFDILG